jgi:replicative DNA helicase
MSTRTRPASPDETGTAPAATPWDAPEPFGATGELPAFPLDALPAWGKAMVDGVSVETQTPADLPGVVYLSALSAAAGGRALVDVRPGWTEPVNLYTAVVLPPGSRKSAVFREMTAPIGLAERQLRESAKAAIGETETARTVADMKAQQAVLKAAKSANDDGNLAADAIKLAALAADITVPPWPRLLADDVTPEALASLLARHGSRLAILSAEGDIFYVMSGRYSAGKILNLGVFLKGHAGDTILVDRKGREPEEIERPALTIGLCIQPQVLVDISAHPALRGRGLLARVLYSLPADIVGWREIEPAAVNGDVRTTYSSNLAGLVMSMDGWTDPARILVSPAALAELTRFQRDVEPRLRAGTGDLSDLRDWASKLVGGAVRIAGLLHLAEHLKDGYGKPIASETMKRAIQLAEYFTEHARAAFRQMGADPVISDARTLLDWIKRSTAAEFSKRDMFRGCQSERFQKATALDAPLALLAEHGYVRTIPPESTGRGGRPPSPKYATNPKILA